MNTIGNQTGANQGRTLSDAGLNLKGTSINMSADGKGVSVHGANAGAIRQTAQITGNMILSQMKTGTSFAGDIIDVCGNAIKLLLSGEKMLSATATDARNLNIGDHIIFNVSSNNGSSVVIKPVKINHFNTNMLLRALEAAEMPATEKNKNMIRAMMEHEMPIDKNSVMEMMKKVDMFKTENPEYIVSMDKHGIPLTQENVEQFGAYKNCEHRIMSQVETIANDIPALLTELAESDEAGKVVSIAKGFVQILSDSLLHNNESLRGKGNIDITLPEENIVLDNIALDNVILENIELKNNEVQNNDIKDLPMSKEDDIVSDNISTQEKLKEPLTKEQVLDKLNTLKGDELKEFIRSDDFKDYVKDKVERSFEININLMPTDGDDAKDMVRNLYENLNKKTAALLELLNNAGQGKGNLAQTATNMRRNMQFMQDLSQMASYVQLPVKFNQGKAHSELYVYNRRKGMPVDKDVITAFLHLDMEYLGATDINVRMERQSITTEFSLSDRESMSIVEENLCLLKERLEKKGFTATFTVNMDSAKEGKQQPFDILLETDKPQISIKRYSFDVRA